MLGDALASTTCDGIPMLSTRARSQHTAAPLEGALDSHSADAVGTSSDTHAAASSTSPQRIAARKRAVLRIVLVFVIGIGALVLAKLTGLTDRLDKQHIRELMKRGGVLGILAFVALFSLGELLSIPGAVFVAAAVVSYGRIVGGVLSYGSGVVSVSVGFAVARLLGGRQPIAGLALPRCLERWIDGLEAYPIRSIVVLRLFFALAPVFNAALGLTRVRFSRYLIGSSLGLVVPVTLQVLLLDATLN